MSENEARFEFTKNIIFCLHKQNNIFRSKLDSNSFKFHFLTAHPSKYVKINHEIKIRLSKKSFSQQKLLQIKITSLPKMLSCDMWVKNVG